MATRKPAAKSVKKPAPKKTGAVKKAAPKKTAPKKAAPKKAAPKKAVAAKAAPKKKTVAAKAAPKKSAAPKTEASVVLHVKLSDGAFGATADYREADALDAKVRERLEQTGAGRRDRASCGGGFYDFTYVGPSRDALLDAVSAVFAEADVPDESFLE